MENLRVIWKKKRTHKMSFQMVKGKISGYNRTQWISIKGQHSTCRLVNYEFYLKIEYDAPRTVELRPISC